MSSTSQNTLSVENQSSVEVRHSNWMVVETMLHSYATGKEVKIEIVQDVASRLYSAITYTKVAKRWTSCQSVQVKASPKWSDALDQVIQQLADGILDADELNVHHQPGASTSKDRKTV